MRLNRRHFVGAAAAMAASASSALLARSTPLARRTAYVGRRDKIGLVDFSLASSERRFSFIDLEGGRIEHMWLVAHGKGSDLANTGYLQRFSNEPGSNASSRGSYVTATPYYGKHGRSQRLIGLDPENSAALDRAIVLHGASYVDPTWIDARGRIGRSFGCFAVEDREINRVMGALGEGRLLYAGKSA